MSKRIVLKPGMYFLRELDMKRYKVVSRSRDKIVSQSVTDLWGAVVNVGEGIKVLTKKEALKGVSND